MFKFALQTVQSRARDAALVAQDIYPEQVNAATLNSAGYLLVLQNRYKGGAVGHRGCAHAERGPHEGGHVWQLDRGLGWPKQRMKRGG